MSGNFLSCIKDVKEPLWLKKEGGISLETPQRKWAYSHGEGRLSWFFLSCGRKLGVLLELQWGSHGPAHVASGKSSLHGRCVGPLRITLQSVLSPSSSSGAEARTSGFHSSADMDFGVPMEFQKGSQASSLVETCKSAFLSSSNSSVWLPIELT